MKIKNVRDLIALFVLIFIYILIEISIFAFTKNVKIFFISYVISTIILHVVVIFLARASNVH